MDYRILGPLEVRDGDRLVGLGGDKQRALLAILLLHGNEAVSTDRLIDELWGESPPASAPRTLQTYVSRLRKALNANGTYASPGRDSAPPPLHGALLTGRHGYLLELAPGELDLDRFQELAERGREALASGRPEDAASLLDEALAVWRGPPLAEFTYEPFAQAAIGQLEELRLAAIEERVEADLARGRAHELVGELRHLVARHPLHERPRGQLMLALYRSGRRAEALEAYQEFRRVLSEQLGLDPGRGVQQLELAILARDPSLDLLPTGLAADEAAAGSPASPGAAARRHARRRLLALGAVLLAAAVVGAIMASGGGGTSLPAGIAGNSVGAITPSGGVIRAVVPLGATPSALGTGAGAVWAADYNAGTVSRIDPATRAVVETIPVGTTPAGIAIGAGAVWVTNNYAGTVSRIDPAVNRVVQTIAVGNAPVGVAVGDGSVWVANSSDGTLTRIDATTGDVLTTIALGSGATDVAAGAGAVWVSDEAGDRVYRVDPQIDQVTQWINVGTGPTAIAVANGSVWVTNSLDGTVSRIDPATNTVGATIAVGDGAGAVAVGGGAVWVTSEYASTVSRIDPVTDTVARAITIGNRPQGVAVAGGLVWVSARFAATGHRGGTLNVVTQGYADTFDPVLTQNLGGVLPLTNDGLTAYRHVGGSGSRQVVPDLAVSLPSPTDGGTTYTFQLRRGIRFSNGELVRPEDFRRALERDLILGPNPDYGGVFANVIGGAACAAHPSGCDLSRGVLTDDAANTVTFHLVAPNPEFLARLTLPDAVAVPAGTPYHDIGLHPLPATGPYEWTRIISRYAGVLGRNPRFHEWSHAARPDGYPDRMFFRHVPSQSAEVAAVEHGSADYSLEGVPPSGLGVLQTRFASQLYVNPAIATDALILNTRVAPFTDVRVRQAINFALDRGEVARLLGEEAQPTCQMLPPSIAGYRRYCPYTLHPNAAGIWRAPNLAEAKRLIAATGTRGTPITIWNFGGFNTDYTAVAPYLVSLLDQLGYPTRVRDVRSFAPSATSRFANSRTRAQAALGVLSLQYPSAPQVIQVNFACQSFMPESPGNANLSEFCDHRLDAQIDDALQAESNNSPDTAALWAHADRTVTNQAPAVPLATPTNIDFVSSRVGNYTYSNAGTPVLLDQLWVR